MQAHWLHSALWGRAASGLPRQSSRSIGSERCVRAPAEVQSEAMPAMWQPSPPNPPNHTGCGRSNGLR